MSSHSYSIAAIVAILALGLWLRLTGLAELGLGFDELQHIYAARGLNEVGEPVLPSGRIYDRSLDFSQMVALSTSLFGDTAFSARLPSALFGTATILLVFWIGRTLLGTGPALLAALLICALPFELVWARTCRMYAVYQFFYLLAGYAFYRGFEPGPSPPGPITRMAERLPMGWILTLGGQVRPGWLVVSLLSLLAAARLHSLTGLLGVSILAYAGALAGLVAVRDGWHALLRSKYLTLTLACLAAVAIVALIPGLLDEIVRQLRFRPDWVGDARPQPTYYLRFLDSPTLTPMSIFFLLGCVLTVTRAQRGAFFAAVLAIVPLAFHSVVALTQSPRYIYDCFPWIVLLSSWAGCSLFAPERDRLRESARAILPSSPLWDRAIQGSLTALIVGCFLVLPTGLRNGTRSALQQGATAGGQYNVAWAEACAFLSREMSSQDTLLASIPLAADYEGCPAVAYNLDNGEIDQFLPGESARFPRHVFADTPAIIDLAGLEEVLAEPGRYWLATDTQRFANAGNTPSDVRDYVIQEFEPRWTAPDGTISIFVRPLPSGAPGIADS